MRRMHSGRAGGPGKREDGEQGFWPSYADMMSAVALILFFLMLLAYIQNLITGNDLRSTQDDLAETRSTLSLTLRQVEDAQSALDIISIDLAEAERTLADQQDELAALDELLADREALIGEQEEYLKNANAEILSMREQMQTIAVLRLTILEQIRDSMAQVMGDASKVRIGESGNIILSESVLFDVGSSEIKTDAAPALRQLARVFATFLSDDENAKYVDSIVVAGHTDSTGTAQANRKLSTDRSNAVLNFLLDNDYGRLDDYEAYFCSAGYGETRPVADNATAAGRTANRRIELSILLRDDTVMDIVENYLDIVPPETQPQTRARTDAGNRR